MTLESPPRPQVGAAAPFILPARDTRALDNGMRTTLVPAGNVPKVSLRLVIPAGSKHEPAGKTWLTRLLAEYMKEGTEHRASDELAEAVAALGGRLRVEPGDDSLTIRTTVLSEHARDAIRLIAEVARMPLFPEAELPRLLADLRRNLDIAGSDPQWVTLARFRHVLYGDHPFGRILPEPATIDGFTLDDVRGFFQRYVGPSGAHLYVAGVFAADDVRSAIDESFGDWRAGEAAEAARPQARSERKVHVVDRPGATQSTIYLGLPCPDPSHADYVPLQLTNALLGGAFSSRITRNIREEKGYTYSPRSALFVRYRDAHWAQVADVTTEVTGASLHEIFGEIDRLRAEAPPAEELEGNQQFLAGNFVLRHATPGGILDQLMFLDLHELGEDFAAAYVERIYAVTPEEVRRIAETYLRPDDMAIAIGGDLAAIEEQVKPYGEIVR